MPEATHASTETKGEPESRVIGQGKFLKLKAKDVVGEDGKGRTIEYLDRPKPVAAVLAYRLDEATGERILMLEINRRDAVGKNLIEAAAGSVEAGETPEQGAKRELEEELGFSVEDIKAVGEGYASPGITNERMFFFIAKVGKYVGQRLEEGEELSLMEVTEKEARRLYSEGKITDNKTHRLLSEYFLRGMDQAPQ